MIFGLLDIHGQEIKTLHNYKDCNFNQKCYGHNNNKGIIPLFQSTTQKFKRIFKKIIIIIENSYR